MYLQIADSLAKCRRIVGPLIAVKISNTVHVDEQASALCVQTGKVLRPKQWIVDSAVGALPVPEVHGLFGAHSHPIGYRDGSQKRQKVLELPSRI